MSQRRIAAADPRWARPRLSAWIAAIADAVIAAWRVYELVTPVPSWIRVVA